MQVIKTDLDKDLEYIHNDLIAVQPNGSYCKYSRLLKEVSTYNFTEKDYIAYWVGLHKRSKQLKLIIDTCKEKLHNNLMSTEEMIELVKASKDRDSEKEKIINYLLGKEQEQKASAKERCSYYYKNEDEINDELEEDVS